MSLKNNVIDMTVRRKAQIRDHHGEQGVSEAEIVDMGAAREVLISDERRANRRTILSEFVGVFIVVPEMGLKKVALYDISEKGVSFDLEGGFGEYKEGEQLAIRVYLSQGIYFPFVVEVRNIRHVADEGVIRHGTVFLPNSSNKEAIKAFVKFIETVGANLRRDNGDLMVGPRR